MLFKAYGIEFLSFFNKWLIKQLLRILRGDVKWKEKKKYKEDYGGKNKEQTIGRSTRDYQAEKNY